MSSERIRTDTYALATQAGRKPGTPGHADALAFVEGRFGSLGLSAYGAADGFRHEYRAQLDGLRMTNLVGVLPGRDRSLPPLLLAAHYDSVIEAPCAGDNAVAVAVLLEVAARLVGGPLQRDVLFVAFDAEEPPYFTSASMGSERFVADVLDSPVHVAVILDLVGHSVVVPGLPLDPDLIFVTGAESHPALPTLLGGLDLPTAALAWRRVGDFSDYKAFREAGAPYLFWSCGEWRDYHTRADRPERLDYDKAARLVGDLLEVLRGADAIETTYHAEHDALDFEVRSLEAAIGAPILAAAASRLGLPDYRSDRALTAIVHALRQQVASG